MTTPTDDEYAPMDISSFLDSEESHTRRRKSRINCAR
jgi:hypothetical protein